MIVRYSKDFAKSVERLSGKELKSVISAIQNVVDAKTIKDISNCKKIESLKNVYRIRIGDRRAFFTLHIEVKDNIVFFEYLVNRGEAYSKGMMDKLRNRDV